MEHKVVIQCVKNKLTGKKYIILQSLRGQYFDLVPRSNPGLSVCRYHRADFTKPYMVEVKC